MLAAIDVGDGTREPSSLSLRDSGKREIAWKPAAVGEDWSVPAIKLCSPPPALDRRDALGAVRGDSVFPRMIWAFTCCLQFFEMYAPSRYPRIYRHEDWGLDLFPW